MRCAACEADNPTGSKFCLVCGHALARGCPSCGTVLPSHARFCNECGTTLTPPVGSAPLAGTALESARASAVAPSPTTERRLCSVLFVDLVGFTPLAEKRDPEEIRDLLSLYFERAQAIIGHYAGTVEKFIGDAVMAIWGAPVANEDDAERAVRAALEVVASVDGARSRVRRGARSPSRNRHRRGGDHGRQGGRRHGARRHRQLGLEGPKRCPAGRRARRRVHLAGRLGRYRLHRGRDAPLEGQGGGGPGLACASGGGPAQGRRTI